MLEELRQTVGSQLGGFLPGVKQIANVAALPGIVKVSVSLWVTCWLPLRLSLVSIYVYIYTFYEKQFVCILKGPSVTVGF